MKQILIFLLMTVGVYGQVTKITQLPERTTPVGTDVMQIVDPINKVNYKVYLDTLNDLISQRVDTADYAIYTDSTGTAGYSDTAGIVTDPNIAYKNLPNTFTATNAFTTAINASITGNAQTVSNGVYTIGNQTISGIKTFSSTIGGSITGNSATSDYADSSGVSGYSTTSGTSYWEKVGNNIQYIMGDVIIGTSLPSFNRTLQMYSDDGWQNRIYFGDSFDSDAGRIFYDHANDGMYFYTNGTPAFSISSSQHLYVSQRMKIGSLVGTPDSTLQVNGSAHINTNLKVDGLINGVKEYVAILSQTGTNDPVVNVMKNTLGGTVVWTRTGLGIYNGTLTGVFTALKTNTLTGGSGLGEVSINPNTPNFCTIITRTDAGVFSDGILSGTTIKIEVYP